MDFQIDNLVDYVRSGALIVLLLIVLFINDRSKFMSIGVLMATGFGIAFAFFPTYLYGFQVSTALDDISLTCCRVLGWAILSKALVWYIMRDTRDGTVPITLMTAQVFSSSVALLCLVYTCCGTVQGTASKDKQPQNPWTPQHFMFSGVALCVELVANLVYLLRSHDFSSYPQHNIRVNEYLRLDAGLAMLASLTCLAFPDLICRHFWPSVTMSPVAGHLIRWSGCYLMNSAFVSLQAAGFLHEKDKKKQFVARLVGIVLLFIPFIQAAVLKNQFTLQQIEYALLAMLPLAINGVLGLMAEGTIVTHNKYR